MTSVALRQTGTTDESAWIRRVFPVAVGVMTAAVDLSSTYDDSSEGLTDAAALHHAMAVCVVAHLGVSCNWGALEFNHNPGLVPCVESGDCAEVPASGTAPAMSLAAFGSLTDGVAGWCAWVRRSSSRGWEMLGQGAVGFWPFFDRDAHIIGTPSAADAVAAFNQVARLMGQPVLAANEVEIAGDDWREAARGTPSTPRPSTPRPSTPRPSTGGGSSSVAPWVVLAAGWGVWWATK